ncbi:MAG: hypothetical protein E7379_03560 [Clostridiales bacterium]|nr:hypothetical protein [Clostridiales bacterium]
MKTIIYSTFDCLLKTPSLEKELLSKKNISFDEINEEISVYPMGRSKIIPFTISPPFKSPFYKTIIYNDARLIFLLDGIYVQNVQVYNFTHNGRQSRVEIATKEIHFSTNRTKKILHLPQHFDRFNCDKSYHINYVLCENCQESLFVAFNTINGKVKTFDGEKIELKNNQISIKCKNGDNLNLYLDKDGLKQKEKTFNEKAFYNPLYVANNFMNEIKKGEYLSALNFLSPHLKEIHSSLSLQEYFGEISYIFPIDLYTIFALSNDKEKIYSFEIEKGKIVDISD